MNTIMTQEEFQLFNDLLVERFGLCFAASKKEILESRLKPRLEALNLRHFMDYYLLLQFNTNGNHELIYLVHQVTKLILGQNMFVKK